MKDVIFDDFQNSVDESLFRHRTILDIMTKLQESEARINRAVAKAASNCGCINIDTKKKKRPDNSNDSDDLEKDIETIKNYMDSQLKGTLCENCRDIIQDEIGNNLFYLAALCNFLDLNLYDILLKEYDKIGTLGKYTLR